MPLLPALWQQRHANLLSLKPAWSTQPVPQQSGLHRETSGGGWVETDKRTQQTNKQARHQIIFSLQQEPNVTRIHCTISYTLIRIRCVIWINKVDKHTVKEKSNFDSTNLKQFKMTKNITSETKYTVPK